MNRPIVAIDISQLVYLHTGVSNYLQNLVMSLVKNNSEFEYVLFASVLRKRNVLEKFISEVRKVNPSVKSVIIPIPPVVLDILWNRLHILPIELFVGKVDIFWSSDWTQPPVSKAIGVTTIHDLSIYKYPEEMHGQTKFNLKSLLIRPNIVATQKRRLEWVKKECKLIFCDSLSTKNDVVKILGINPEKLIVNYSGYSI